MKEAILPLKEKILRDYESVDERFLLGLAERFTHEAISRFLEEDGPRGDQELSEARSVLKMTIIELFEDAFGVDLKIHTRGSEWPRFEANGDLVSEFPTGDVIRETLKSLPGGLPSFAILLRSEMTYIQAGGSGGEGFVLEYQEGSLDRHYRSADESLDLERATKILTLYLRGDESWHNEVEWKHIDV